MNQHENVVLNAIYFCSNIHSLRGAKKTHNQFALIKNNSYATENHCIFGFYDLKDHKIKGKIVMHFIFD